MRDQNFALMTPSFTAGVSRRSDGCATRRVPASQPALFWAVETSMIFEIALMNSDCPANKPPQFPLAVQTRGIADGMRECVGGLTVRN